MFPQQLRRPTIDQLKQNPHLNRYMQHHEFTVKEATFKHRCAAKEAELKRREEALDRREKELNAREARLLEAQRDTLSHQQNLMGPPITTRAGPVLSAVSGYPNNTANVPMGGAGKKYEAPYRGQPASAYGAIAQANHHGPRVI